jgi:hypothetical protein
MEGVEVKLEPLWDLNIRQIPQKLEGPNAVTRGPKYLSSSVLIFFCHLQIHLWKSVKMNLVISTALF